MKIGAITSYNTNFGNNQDKKTQNPIKNPLAPVGSQPLAGLISPKKPLPSPPVVTSPIGGLIGPPPKRPKNPHPAIPGPIGGLITPSPKRQNVPQIPVVTAGLISPKKPEEIKKEIAKIEEKQ